MNVLLTGGTGFVGRNLLREFMFDEKYDLTVLTRKTSNTEYMDKLGVNWVAVDLNRQDTYAHLLRDCDIFIHAAAIVRACSWEQFVKNNIETTKNIVDALNDNAEHLQKFIFISSQAAAGPSDIPLTEANESKPINWYGHSKLLCEKYIQQNMKRPFVILRPVSVYGPGDKDFLLYFKMISAGIFAYTARFTKKISIVYIDDLVNAIMRAIKSSISGGETYFIAAEDTTLLDFGREIIKVHGKHIFKIKIPHFLVKIAAYFNFFNCFFQHKPGLIYPNKIKEADYNWLISSKKAERELLFRKTVDLAAGVKNTYEWYVENGYI